MLIEKLFEKMAEEFGPLKYDDCDASFRYFFAPNGTEYKSSRDIDEEGEIAVYSRDPGFEDWDFIGYLQ